MHLRALAVALILAGGITFLVIGWGHKPDYGPITCSGQVMSPGDMCNRYERGTLVSAQPYEEMAAAQHRLIKPNLLELSLGTILTLLGLYLLYRFWVWTRPIREMKRQQVEERRMRRHQSRGTAT
jgi:hypothetical protein